MNFWDLIDKLSNSGTCGIALAIIILIVAGLWWFNIFMLPFHISHMRDDIDKMQRDIERVREKAEEPK